MHLYWTKQKDFRCPDHVKLETECERRETFIRTLNPATQVLARQQKFPFPPEVTHIYEYDREAAYVEGLDRYYVAMISDETGVAKRGVQMCLDEMIDVLESRVGWLEYSDGSARYTETVGREYTYPVMMDNNGYYTAEGFADVKHKAQHVNYTGCEFTRPRMNLYRP